jgi:hypothetical protein
VTFIAGPAATRTPSAASHQYGPAAASIDIEAFEDRPRRVEAEARSPLVGMTHFCGWARV